jgi:hypothetical protein
MGLKEDFLRIYADIPINIRSQIILVFNGEPITWNVVYTEVIGNSKRSGEMLKKLKELGLI